MTSAAKISRKRTKIVCTIGPASSSLEVLTDMIKAGMNVARFNFSHGTHDSNLKLLKTVRRAAKATKSHVALLLDLQGPKIRIGELPAEGMELKEGSIVTLVVGDTRSEPNTIPLPYPELGSTLKAKDIILLDDGTKELQVIRRSGNRVQARVLLGGTLLSRKGFTIPRAALDQDALTAKDEEDLRFGLKQGIDFVALSFVRGPQDVIKLKRKIKLYLPSGRPAPAIIVKIEKPEALDHFDAILAETDGVMIARGDLGLETPISQVPLHQKEIIHKCLAAGKPVITATEMLGSMQYNPRPTRAEVSDVANAVFDHTDAVMLSAETAMGRHPTRAVRMMSDIITVTESSPLLMPTPPSITKSNSPLAIAESVIKLAQDVAAKAIIVNTMTGYFARAFSRLRPSLPLLALSPSASVCQQLLLSWGVTPLLAGKSTTPAQLSSIVKQELFTQHRLRPGDQVLVVSSDPTSKKSNEYDIHLVTLKK